MLRAGTVAFSGEMVKPPMLTHGLLEAMPGVKHGFFTREGGVSTGLYKSLNCGVGSKDDRALVFKNRARAARALGVVPEKLATPHQIHSATAVVVDSVWEPGKGPQADAVVTARPGVAVGVGTADCGPILFADPTARVVGATHAGWRGAFSGVLEATIEAMVGLGADRDRMVAVLGPLISQRNYEVSADFVGTFTAADPDNERWFKAGSRPGHAQFDLSGYILVRIGRAGVLAADLGLCTYADEARFFSYRRATHRGEGDYGRLLSAIALEE